MLLKDIHVSGGPTLGFPTYGRPRDPHELTHDVMLLETNIHSNIVLLRVVETSHMSGLGNDHALLSTNATITVTTGKTTVMVVLLAIVIPVITFAVPLS